MQTKRITHGDKRLINNWNKRSPFRPCELCHKPRILSPDFTVCTVCDKQLEKQYAREDAARARKLAHRKCRLCKGALELSRYFSCKACIPDADMESEDINAERITPFDFE